MDKLNINDSIDTSEIRKNWYQFCELIDGNAGILVISKTVWNKIVYWYVTIDGWFNWESFTDEECWFDWIDTQEMNWITMVEFSKNGNQSIYKLEWDKLVIWDKSLVLDLEDILWSIGARLNNRLN
jgi:hypothetical protein